MTIRTAASRLTSRMAAPTPVDSVRPAGRINALLLYKSDITNAFIHQNDYLIGYLLGYNEEDIQQYYRNNIEFSFNQPNDSSTTQEKKNQIDQSLFNIDKKRAMEWIEQNTPTIEEWFAAERK